MKRTNVYLNYIYNLSYQLLVLLVPLIITPHISRVLGAEGIGAYSYTNSIIQYFILFGCIGLNLYGQKQIAFVQDNVNQRSKVFFELFIIRVITISISLMVYYFTFMQNEKYHLLFYIQSIDILASIFDISWFFQGIEEFKKIVLRNYVVKIIGVIFILTFVNQQEDVYLYALCYSLTLLLGNLSMWFYLRKYVKRMRFQALEISKHIRPTLVLFLPQIATSIYTTLDKTMIGLLTSNDAEVAYYEQSQKIIRVAMFFLTSLGTVMMPRVANTFANGDHQQIHKYINNSIKFVFFLGFPLMFGVIGISKGLIPWFYGDGFEKVLPNMILISPIIVLIGLSNVIGVQYLLPTNRQHGYTVSVFIGSIVNFTFNLLLIPHFLSLGAAVATVLAEISVTAYQMYIIRKKFKIIKIFIMSIKSLFASLCMLIVLLLLGNFFAASMFYTLLEILIGCIIYIFLLVILKEEIVLSVIRKCFRL